MRSHRLVLAATTFAGAVALGLIVAVPLRAQSPSRADSTEFTAPLPSVALPPALERVLRDYERAWRAGDARAVAALFTPDGVVLSSGRPPARGRRAIEAVYAGQGGPLVLRALAFATADSIGYIIGAYGYAERSTPAREVGRTPVPDMGKFTLTLRREHGRDGRWLIFSDMDNSSSRPRRP
jgi:ketosteroid isomerase-like protein